MSVPGQARLRGAKGFASHYASLFGERWPALERALLDAPAKVLRVNAFATTEAQRRVTAGLEPHPLLEGCFDLDGLPNGVGVASDSAGLLVGYVMDAASVLAARALDVRPGEDVLDLCAAPGGKALVLMEALREHGRLTTNDRSKRRCARLRAVLRQHLPEPVLARVRVACRDGRQWGLYEPEAYDAVLLDAPCSSERHVLTDGFELSKWSSSRIRRLAMDQYALLVAGITTLRHGGRLVYSTCALTTDENDRVIQRLLDKKRHAVELDRLNFGMGEATRHGWQVHPDRHGSGPLYFARLVRS